MRKGLSIFLIFFSLVVCGFSQPAGTRLALPANVSEAKLDSKLMGHSMPYRVIVPAGYSKAAAKRYPVIYLLHGLTGHYPNWTTLGTLPKSAEAFNFIFVTPEGDNGWYNDSPTIANAKYESYIIQELIPEIDAKYRTINDRTGRAIAGLSMGGYGTFDAIERYPNLFAAAMPVCGGGDTSKAAMIAHLPIWIFHGAEDPAVNPVYSLYMFQALTRAGAHPGFTQYPEVGHFSWLGAYSDPLMMEWLFRQHK